MLGKAQVLFPSGLVRDWAQSEARNPEWGGQLVAVEAGGGSCPLWRERRQDVLVSELLWVAVWGLAVMRWSEAATHGQPHSPDLGSGAHGHQVSRPSLRSVVPHNGQVTRQAVKERHHLGPTVRPCTGPSQSSGTNKTRNHGQGCEVSGF